MSESTEFGIVPKGTRPSPQPTEKFDRLKDLLRTMFQLNHRHDILNLLQLPNDSWSSTAIELVAAR